MTIRVLVIGLSILIIAMTLSFKPLMVNAAASNAPAALATPSHKQITQNTDTTMSDINPGLIELVHGNGDVQHAIIWLHGLGATANDFPPIVPELGLSPERAIRFIFPQAPNRAITVNGGMQMPGWYDIKGMDIADKQDREGISESQQLLEALVQQQLDAGIASSNIILAGFSQGGAVVYHTFGRSQHKFAGVLALSTYLPFAEQLADEQTEVNLSTPIFAGHGSYDPVVPLSLGQASAEHLVAQGYQLEWHSYPMQHQVILEQIKDIGSWINKTFN